jgi:hypothetical protein
LARLDLRLRDGGASARVYPPDELPSEVPHFPREEQYVVADREEIRGSVYLRLTSMIAGGVRFQVGYVKYPVAESLVDKKYAGVPVAMMRHLQKLQPELLVMGMGGLSGPFAQFLSRMRWRGHTIPTVILPLQPTRILRHLPHLAARTTLVRIARVLDWLGGGMVLSGAVRLTSAVGTRWLGRGAITEPLLPGTSDGSVYSRVSASVVSSYPLMVDRDAKYATWMFPEHTQGAHRLHVQTAPGHDGYVHIQYVDLRERRSSPYGPLRLAVLQDMLAVPEAARGVVAAGVDLARRLDADLVLMTHSHPAWLTAARRCGFLMGPDNFACMRSPALDQKLAELGIIARDLYVTRADDGVLSVA